MKKYVASALVALGLMTGSAQAAPGSMTVEVGVLTCDVAPGWGKILGSSRTAQCVFKDTLGFVSEYTADITKLGLDIGFAATKTLSWTVVAAGRFSPNNLRGVYVGPNAEGSFVVGAGANVMVGGMRDTIALQPVSVQMQTGFGVAAAVQVLTLY